MNNVILIGNLGSDPDMRHTQSGTAVANLSIATNESYKDKDGEWQDKTEWHRVVVWGAQAENCAKYLSKGSKVGVSGKLQTRKWEDDDGNARYTTEVVARNVEFLTKSSAAGADVPDEGDDDLPF